MSVAAVAKSESDENDALEMLRINVRHWRKESGLAFRYMPVYLWGDPASNEFVPMWRPLPLDPDEPRVN